MIKFLKFQVLKNKWIFLVEKVINPKLENFWQKLKNKAEADATAFALSEAKHEEQKQEQEQISEPEPPKITEVISEPSKRVPKPMDHSESAFYHCRKQCKIRYGFEIDLQTWSKWNELILSNSYYARLVDDHEPPVYVVSFGPLDLPVSFNGQFVSTVLPDFCPSKDMKYTELPEIKKFVPRISDKERKKLEQEKRKKEQEQKKNLNAGKIDVVHPGVVKWYDPEKGFGFIQIANTDAFVHAKIVRASGETSLLEGSKVSVKINRGEKGLNVSWLSVIQKPKMYELPPDMSIGRNGVPFRPRMK